MASMTGSPGSAHAVIRDGRIVEHDNGAATYHRVEYFRPGA
jgi:hypothetical protein